MKIAAIRVQTVRLGIGDGSLARTSGLITGLCHAGVLLLELAGMLHLHTADLTDNARDVAFYSGIIRAWVRLPVVNLRSLRVRMKFGRGDLGGLGNSSHGLGSGGSRWEMGRRLSGCHARFNRAFDAIRTKPGLWLPVRGHFEAVLDGAEVIQPSRCPSGRIGCGTLSARHVHSLRRCRCRSADIDPTHLSRHAVGWPHRGFASRTVVLGGFRLELDFCEEDGPRICVRLGPCAAQLHDVISGDVTGSDGVGITDGIGNGGDFLRWLFRFVTTLDALCRNGLRGDFLLFVITLPAGIDACRLHRRRLARLRVDVGPFVRLSILDSICSHIRDRLRTDRTSPCYLAICPLAPFGIIQQGQDGAALVAVGPAKAMRFVGADAVQDSIAAGAWRISAAMLVRPALWQAWKRWKPSASQCASPS